MSSIRRPMQPASGIPSSHRLKRIGFVGLIGGHLNLGEDGCNGELSLNLLLRCYHACREIEENEVNDQLGYFICVSGINKSKDLQVA